MQTIFITGGTGYIGTRLIKALLKEGDYHIKALARKGSEQKLPAGCEVVEGNALPIPPLQKKKPLSRLIWYLYNRQLLQ